MLRNLLALMSELLALGKVLADPDVPVADKVRAAVPFLKAAAALTPNAYDDQAVQLVERVVNSDQFDDVVQFLIQLLNGQSFASGEPSEAQQAAQVIHSLIAS